MSVIQPSRRGFITGLATLIAAPAIIRVADLMPIKSQPRFLLTELQAITRKAFLPRVYTQIYADHSLLALFEGSRLKDYEDLTGVRTIGHGVESIAARSSSSPTISA